MEDHARHVGRVLEMLLIRQREGGVVAWTTLGLAYEGPPGFLHGGMSALFMDQLLGAAGIAAGLWGMTVRLEASVKRLLTSITVKLKEFTVEVNAQGR